MAFGERLVSALVRAGNPVLAGIDPRVESLPRGFLDHYPENLEGRARAFAEFGKGVADVLGPLVPAVKFQTAFYEVLGPSGLFALHESMAHAKARGLLVILDGKRNDIGSTAEAYAQAYLGDVAVGPRRDVPWGADALTVNPYLGTDGIRPFVDVAAPRQKGVFVLVRTSNPSARELQDPIADGRSIFRRVADLVNEWAAAHRDASGYSVLGAVVGATYPEQLAELREAMPGIFFLVPGYGAQGGTATDVAAAFDSRGLGALVNNSRGLTFAYQRKDLADRFGGNWQRAIEEAAREMIADLAIHTPAGRLTSRGASPS